MVTIVVIVTQKLAMSSHSLEFVSHVSLHETS